MYILGMIILVFFAVIGIASFVGGVVKSHFKCDTKGFILLICDLSENNAEAKIRSAAIMTEEAKDCRIICVCAGDHPARAICEKMQKQYPQIEIVDEYEYGYT